MPTGEKAGAILAVSSVWSIGLAVIFHVPKLVSPGWLVFRAYAILKVYHGHVVAEQAGVACMRLGS